MRKLIIIICLTFVFGESTIDKILNYHFKIDLNKIRSPFYPKEMFTKKKKKFIIRYDYIVVSIIGDMAKLKVIKYVNGIVNNINYIFIKKGYQINNCKVINITNKIKLKCKNKIKILKLQNIKIPYIKEVK